MNSLTKRILGFGVLLLAALSISCSNDHTSDPTPEGGIDEDGLASIMFSVSVPAVSGPATRAMTLTDESYVQTVDVMIFDNGKFYYTAPGYQVDNSKLDKKNFRVRMPVGTFDILVLANARDIITASGINRTTDKDDAIEMLTKASNVGDKWDASTIPMFGYRNNLKIDENTDMTGANSIKMVRMLARIDVAISHLAATGDDDTSVTGNGNFSLESVALYNYSTEGRLVPDISAGSSGWNPVRHIVTEPTEPNNGYGQAKGQSLVYTSADEHDDEAYLPDSLFRVIYTFEAENGGDTSLDTNPCLVVGGKYNNGPTTYYRVDFIDKTTSAYMDLMRNHRYRVFVNSVNGHGYPTPGEAFNSRPINMDADIIAWEEGEMNDVSSDGQYQLTVDHSELVFYIEGGDLILNIYTDHPEGWSIADAEKPDWVTLSDNEGNAGVRVPVRVSVGASDARDGQMLIRAGRIVKIIDIVQLAQARDISIEVTPNQLVFYRNPVAKSVTVTTYPGNIVRFLSSSGTVVWAQGKSPEDYNSDQNGGVTSFEFLPEVNDEGKFLASFVTIYIEKDGEIAQQTITVRQLATNMLFEASTESVYPVAAGEYEFTVVKSQVPWSIQIKAGHNPDGMVELTDLNEYPADLVNPTDYSFGLKTNPGYLNRTATVLAVSTDPEFADYEIDIVQSGTAPFLEVAAGTSTARAGIPTIDFGLSGNDDEIEVTTNATKWKYTTSGDFSKIVKTTGVAPGSSHSGAADATQTVNPTITLTPATAGDDSFNTDAAGTVLTGTLTFATDINQNGVTEVTNKLVAVKRTVPARWTFTSWNHNAGTILPNAGGAVTATVGTNAAWTLESTDAGGANVSEVAADYTASGSLTYTVPKYGVWTDTPRDITFSAESVGFTPATIALKQHGYTAAFSTAATNIGKNGGDLVITVSTTTAVPTFDMRAVEDGTTDVVSDVVSGAAGNRTLKINGNGSGGDRDVRIQYYNSTVGGYVDTDIVLEQISKNPDINIGNMIIVSGEDVDTEDLNWANAKAACEAQGYRLPTQIELQFIYLYKYSYDFQFVEDGYFSSTEISYKTDYAWYMKMGPTQQGYTDDTSHKTHAKRVRCVKSVDGNQDAKYPYVISDPDGPIIVSNDGGGGSIPISGLRENVSGNLPNDHIETSEYNRIPAKLQVHNGLAVDPRYSIAVNKYAPTLTLAGEYCNALPNDGGNMWRVPNQRELMLIWVMGGGTTSSYNNDSSSDQYNTSLGSLAVGNFNYLISVTAAFTTDTYSSMTISTANSDANMLTNMNTGRTFEYYKDNQFKVRCVRDVD